MKGASTPTSRGAVRNANIYRSLTDELLRCSRRKLKFQSVGLLAEHLSGKVSVHRTTLIRNRSYRALLLRYVMGPGVVDALYPVTDPVVLQAKLALYQLEVGNLKQELARLKLQTAVQTNGSAGAEVRDFADLAMILVEILRRSEAFFEIDYRSRAIIDVAAKSSEKHVAGPNRTAKFIAWMEENQSIPAVAALRHARAIDAR